MGKYSIYYDPDIITESFKSTPFNLKKDLKPFSQDDIERFAEEIVNEICHGTERPPLITTPHWDKSRNYGWIKVRLEDKENNRGKSGGYRCIVLIDKVLNAVFVLHIYRHGRVKADLNIKEIKALNSIVDEYAKAMETYKFTRNYKN